MPECRVGVGGDDRDVGGGGELAWVVLVIVLVCVRVVFVGRVRKRC